MKLKYFFKQKNISNVSLKDVSVIPSMITLMMNQIKL